MNKMSTLNKKQTAESLLENLKSVTLMIDEFSNRDPEEKYLKLPFRLLKKQRAVIHEYIKNKNLYSSSIDLRGPEKLIVVHRDRIEQHQSTLITRDNIVFFSEHIGIDI